MVYNRFWTLFSLILLVCTNGSLRTQHTLNNMSIPIAAASTLPASPSSSVSDTLAQMQILFPSLFTACEGQGIRCTGDQRCSVSNEAGTYITSLSVISSQGIDITEAALSLGLDLSSRDSPSFRESDCNTANSNTDKRPRCFDHGCDGRTFSCAENYRRHIREQSRSSRVSCPYCSLSFSRRSNRDMHVSYGRCKALAAIATIPGFLA